MLTWESRSVTIEGLTTTGARMNCITLHAMTRPSYEFTELVTSAGPTIPPGPRTTGPGRRPPPPPVRAATLLSQLRISDSTKLTDRGIPILAFITTEQY